MGLGFRGYRGMILGLITFGLYRGHIGVIQAVSSGGLGFRD